MRSKKYKKHLTAKRRAWSACSKYIRLRDAIEFCKDKPDYRILPAGHLVVKCCTCPDIKKWRRMDAGHYKGRGMGGWSGAYFDERNIHAQCKSCNGFYEGRKEIYAEFLKQKYGENILIDLEIEHQKKKDYSAFACQLIEQYYLEEHDKLVKEWENKIF